jgi:hypothetical protein
VCSTPSRSVEHPPQGAFSIPLKEHAVSPSRSVQFPLFSPERVCSVPLSSSAQGLCSIPLLGAGPPCGHSASPRLLVSSEFGQGRSFYRVAQIMALGACVRRLL